MFNMKRSSLLDHLVQETQNIRFSRKKCRLNIRKYSFSQRIVDAWNDLPSYVVESKSVNAFKSQLNKHWKDLEIKFSPDIYNPEENRITLRWAQGAV